MSCPWNCIGAARLTHAAIDCIASGLASKDHRECPQALAYIFYHISMPLTTAYIRKPSSSIARIHSYTDLLNSEPFFSFRLGVQQFDTPPTCSCNAYHSLPVSLYTYYCCVQWH